VAQLELKNGGEFNLLQCDLILSDGTLSNIVPAIIGLTIFEGINQFTISGTISIQDSFNLASSGPIIGQEYLRIKIATPNLTGGENTIDYSSNPLIITSVDDREDVGNGVQVTTMSFASREFVINQRVRVRRTLIGSYSGIVEKILKTDLNSDKTMDIEPSSDNKKMNATNIKPFEVITIATKRAISEKYNDATYFFWESTSGFNFRTLGNMYSKEPVMTYEFTMSGTRTKDGTKDIMAELSAIEAYTITSSPDTLFNYSSGVFSSELIVHDIISKSYEKHTYKYSDNFSKEQHLGPSPLAINDPDGVNVSSFPSTQYLKPTVGTGNDQGFDDDNSQYVYSGNGLESLQSRRSQLSMLESGLQMSINVIGTTAVKAGDIVEIKIPSTAAYKTTKNETEDMLYNGNFLVKNLRHDFDFGENKHTMSMNIIKDAIGKIT
jgi:hypothetical protein